MQLQHLPTSLCLLRSLATRHSVSRQLSTSPSLHKEQFVRDRVNLNVVTLGAAQHGKTWLASELSRALAAEGDGVAVRTPEMIDHSASEREHGRSEHASHLELWRRDSRFRLTLADLPGHTAYARNLLNHLAHADAALLLVSPTASISLPGPGTRPAARGLCILTTNKSQDMMYQVHHILRCHVPTSR